MSLWRLALEEKPWSPEVVRGALDEAPLVDIDDIERMVRGCDDWGLIFLWDPSIHMAFDEARRAKREAIAQGRLRSKYSYSWSRCT